MRCLWTQSAQDINGFPPNFHPPDPSSTGIHKDSMGFKWFNQQSIGVICGKPKIFIEVGDELWHWFHMFYIVLSRYWSWKENPLQRHTFESLIHFKRNPTSEVNFQTQKWRHTEKREKTGHAGTPSCSFQGGYGVSLKLWTAKVPWASSPRVRPKMW